MKTFIKIITISLIFFSLNINAQSFVVSNDKQNNLYMGLENPLTAIVEKMKCGSFILTTDNGEILEKENCRYVYNAERIGTATISIIKVKGKDTVLIGKSFFHVKEIPKPIATIAGKNSGIIDKSLLIAAGGIINRIVEIDIEIYVSTISNTTLIIKNNNSVYFREIKGTKYTEELIQELYKLSSNDRVYFLDIIAKWPND